MVGQSANANASKVHLPLKMTIAVSSAYSALSTLSMHIRRQKLNRESATYEILALL